MPPFTGRHLRLHSPKFQGLDELHVRRLVGRDGLSQPYEYEVDLLCRSNNLDMGKLLGEELCVALALSLGVERYFHGYVAGLAQIDEEGEYTLYRAVVRPHLWRLTRHADCRIFQGERVPDIVATILREHGITHVETHYERGDRAPYLPWEYCVQYRESDFNFVSRLMEAEGIYYFFRHEADKHTLVLTDCLRPHQPITGYEQVEYRRAGARRELDAERIWNWRITRKVVSDTYAARDYDFAAPGKDLVRASGGARARQHGRPVQREYQVFDAPLPVVQQKGYEPQLLEEYARLRIEEEHAGYEVMTGTTNARGVHVGSLFSITKCPRDDQNGPKFLVTGADLRIEQDERRTGGESLEPLYECVVHAINSAHPYRPARVTPKPVVQGPQPATVVGKEGEKVWTDQHGRVVVKFHWDRAPGADQGSSCFVPVAQSWAGQNWGTLFLPHVGQEVVVGFYEGDPDRPVIIGRVYNGRNQPPVTLPEHRYKSIIRDEFGNEIVMDGTPGSEHMSLYSPSHHSVLQLGRSIRTFTHDKEIKRTLDSETYHLGKKISYTRGISFSVDRGFMLSAKLGASASATVGSDLSVSGGLKASFAGGGNVSFSASWNMSWGLAREFKYTAGAYKRSSKSDVFLDSAATVYITGGAGDRTLIVADNQHLSLSFDEPTQERMEELKDADARARKFAVGASTVLGVVSAAAATIHSLTIFPEGCRRNVNGTTEEVDMEFTNLQSLLAGDVPVVSAAVAAALAAYKGVSGKDMKPPKHDSPSARVLLEKNLIRLHAGSGPETELILTKDDGVTADCEKAIFLRSKHDRITANAKGALVLRSGEAVTVKGTLKCRNLQVSE